MTRNALSESCRQLWKTTGRGKWLAAVSGGADSTALFTALRIARIPFEAANCNFNLRGNESRRDSEFVRALCINHGVALHYADFDTRSEMMPGESVEMACRRLRYDFFQRLKEAGGFSRIAVAHNSDDNIETFLLNALRGCGTRGLRGMEQDNGQIARPLLQFSRREILQFLQDCSQDFMTDSTNLESDYRRNFLRNMVVPLLEEEWPGARKALRRTVELMAAENRIIESAISGVLATNPNLLPWEVARNFPDVETLVYRFIQPYGGTPAIAAEISRSAATPVPGKHWTLNPERRLTFSRAGMVIEAVSAGCAEKSFEDAVGSYRIEVLQPGTVDMERICSASPSEVFLPLPPEHYRWEPATKGIRIEPLGMRGSQDIMKVLRDAGLTAEARKAFPVLVAADSGEAIWLPGLRRSRHHLIATVEKPVTFICPS